MTDNQTREPAPRKLLRLWPGVAAALLLGVVRFIIPIVVPGTVFFGMIGGLIGTLVIVVWWLFFSRAPWPDRVGAIFLMIAALFVTSRLVHQSIATGGMGMLFFIYAIPVLGLALVAGALICRRLSDGFRRASMIAIVSLACGAFTLVRTGGITGEGDSDFHWRWSQTPEERLLTQAGEDAALLMSDSSGAPEEPEQGVVPEGGSEPAAAPSALPLAESSKEATPPTEAAKPEADWPGFRGPRRDDIVRGVRIETDWSQSPPVKLWRRPIGPGWSSFAVRGDLCYTQEQRGEDEMVACYKVRSGEPVWRHRDAVRFWESNGGAGPRATPALNNGRVYAFGATGILNALNASNGAVVWSRNVAADADTKVPTWGFASSPLVIDDLVIVAAAGKLVAYDAATGRPRWFGPAHGGSYSSPHRSRIDGVTQILLESAAGLTSIAPSDGALLWEHAWPGATIVQPALIGDGDVLITTSDMSGGIGTRRLAVTHGSSGWTVEERWTSNGLKPYFNDFVVHKGHAFGFDGSILACIELEDGKRKWKGGRYGNGQLVLLADQDMLLVLSEEGELALVGATPDQYKELARFPGIEGKTWNHPVLVGDVLLVRNGEEMAAFRLSLAGR